MTAKPTKGRIRPLLSGLILRSQTDERLGLLAGAGNEQAFSTIYERYQRELGSHARRIVRADRADDLVQHAMLAAWTALLGGTEISDLRAWLHRVVHNAALDTVTRRGYDDSDIPYSAIAPARTDELAEGRLSAASALAAIAALPESQRRALTLTAVEGRSGHDAALEMGISESAMRQLVYRARSGVRGAITALVPLPLISRLVEAAGAPPAAIAVGAAGGGAASVAKIVGAIGIAAATVGATHALGGHHQPRHAPSPRSSSLASTTPAERDHQAAFRVQRPSVNERSTPATPYAAGRKAGTQQQAGGQDRPSVVAQDRSSVGAQNRSSGRGQSGSWQSGSGNNTTHQSRSQHTAGGAHGQQSGTQQQAAPTAHTASAAPSASTGQQSQQSPQASPGTSSGQPDANPSSALQNGQLGGG